MPSNTPFPELIRFKAPDGFSAALAILARREYCSIAEYIRRRLIGDLRAQGIDIDATPHRLRRDASAVAKDLVGAIDRTGAPE